MACATIFWRREGAARQPSFVQFKRALQDRNRREVNPSLQSAGLHSCKVKAQSKKRWFRVSSCKLHKQQSVGIDMPQETKRSFVGSLFNWVTHIRNTCFGVALLNQTEPYQSFCDSAQLAQLAHFIYIYPSRNVRQLLTWNLYFITDLKNFWRLTRLIKRKYFFNETAFEAVYNIVFLKRLKRKVCLNGCSADNYKYGYHLLRGCSEHASLFWLHNNI